MAGFNSIFARSLGAPFAAYKYDTFIIYIILHRSINKYNTEMNMRTKLVPRTTLKLCVVDIFVCIFFSSVSSSHFESAPGSSAPLFAFFPSISI